MPVAETEATEGLVLLQVPPVTESVSVVVVPAQSDDAPVIAPATGAVVTVTVAVATVVPQVPVTV